MVVGDDDESLPLHDVARNTDETTNAMRFHAIRFHEWCDRIDLAYQMGMSALHYCGVHYCECR
jgi:hypothetical protein